MLDDIFFFIDSGCLGQVGDRFIGYRFSAENAAADGEGPAQSPAGTFVEIRREGGRVTVRADPAGNFHLFLYRRDGYFAFSNSLLLLAERLAGTGTSLTLNRDYASVLLGVGLAHLAYRETIFREIELLPRDTFIEIDEAGGGLELKRTGMAGCMSVPLDSAEAFAILDRWHAKWGAILSLASETAGVLPVELSGGMDSRAALAVLLSSGVDRSRIRAVSFTDDLHTHSEDREIAGEICRRFGLAHNCPDERPSVPLGADLVIEGSFLAKLFEHKQMYFKRSRSREACFVLGGKGGESIRGAWVMPPGKFIAGEVRTAGERSGTLEGPVRSFLGRAFAGVAGDCGFSDVKDPFLTLAFYRNTRARSHFGTDAVECLPTNLLTLSPLLDPDLDPLEPCGGGCSDPDLLLAVIFMRWCPELLGFRFDKKKKRLAPATLECAERLSKKHPPREAGSRAWRLEVGLTGPGPGDLAQAPAGDGELDGRLGKFFRSGACHSLFCMNFGEEVYDWVRNNARLRKYHPMSNAWPVIAVALATELCMRSSTGRGAGVAGVLDSLSSASSEDPDPSVRAALRGVLAMARRRAVTRLKLTGLYAKCRALSKALRRRLR